ncbi:MAG: hypothetical protein H6839_04565 [Planctomycetes bacterium]|nr:hypothetical protein [Planctomycetota bacterium]
MADLAKLANLSKRLKSSTPKVNDEQSPLSGGSAPAAVDDEPVSSPEPRAAAVAQAAPAVSSGGGGGGPAKVTVNMDLGPVTDMLGRLRDEMKNLREEMKKTREKGLKVEFGDTANEQMDQVLKHLSSVSKAGRELTEKLVTSLPESRWYGDLLKLGTEVGEGIVAGGGGGGGGGGNPEDINAIKEQLEMQKTQLTAILSILQRR